MKKQSKYYPAKLGYQNKKSVSIYDSERFYSIKGKFMDYFEKQSVLKLVNKYFASSSYFLDIPVGTGRIAEVLLNHGFKVMGADISKEMIKLSEKKLRQFGEKIEYKIEDAENISFKDNYFDGITSVRFFGHLPYEIKKTILKEMLRVSNNGIIVTFYYDNIIQKIKRKIKHLIKKNKAPWYPLKFNQIKQIIADCGGIVVDRKFVFPIISEGVTYYIKNYENHIN